MAIRKNPRRDYRWANAVADLHEYLAKKAKQWIKEHPYAKRDEHGWYRLIVPVLFFPIGPKRVTLVNVSEELADGAKKEPTT